MDLAPILLFTYKRLDTLKDTVKALSENLLAVDSHLYIFSDGAKNDNDFVMVSKVREYLKTVHGFKSIEIIESSKNKGLATSIIDGVTYIFERHDKVIVLEDDLSTTQNFLAFMNHCLNRYRSNDNVFSVSGYSFDLGKPKWDSDIYFLNRGWSWGWATWRDRWTKVDWNVEDYSTFKKDRLAKSEFAKGGSDLNGMLRKQMEGKLDSWAIRFFYSQFKLGGLTVYPVMSKVYNNGFDQFATHTTGASNRYIPKIDTSKKIDFVFPQEAVLSVDFQKRFRAKMGINARIISKLQTIFTKFLKR